MTDSKRIDRKDAEIKGTLTATVAMALDGLTDVDASSPSNGDALTWVAANNDWEPVAGGGGTPTASQLLTTTADTTTTLDGTYASDLLITGTAVMQVYNLGTATAYANGKRFTFYNNTPEFVGVLNSDATVWHRVPPRAKCVCVLQSNSTAAGVWWSGVDESENPSHGFHAVNELYGQIATGVVNSELSLANLSSSGGTTVQDSTTTATGLGVMRRLVTTAAGYTYSLGPRYMLFGGGTVAVETIVSFSSLSSAAEEFIYRFGAFNNITGGAPTDGAYLLYDRASYGDFFATRTIAAGGGNTTNTTSVVPSVALATPNHLRMEVSSAGTRAAFWSGTTLLFTHTTAANIPTTVECVPQFGLTKTVGSVTSRVSYTDLLGFEKWFTVAR